MGNHEKYIWEAKLDADMNHRYFMAIHERFREREKRSRIALGLMTSGTVATWSFWNAGYGEVLWKVLSALAAAWSVISPLLNWSKRAESAFKLKVAYQVVLSDYELLWLQLDKLDEKSVLKRIESIQKQKNDLAVIEKELPTADEELILKCQEAVEKARGLKGKSI